MTSKERAETLIKSWQNKTMWTEEMLLDIEKALIEERRAGAEGEREACIQVLRDLIPVTKENQALLRLTEEKIRARPL